MNYVILEKTRVVAVDFEQAIRQVAPEANVRLVKGVDEFKSAFSDLGAGSTAIVSAPLSVIRSSGLAEVVKAHDARLVWLSDGPEPIDELPEDWLVLSSPVSSDVLASLIVNDVDPR